MLDAPTATRRGREARGDRALTIRDLLSYRLHVVANLLSRGAEMRYRREFGVSLWEWRTVALLGAQAPLSLNELAAAAGIDKSQMSRVVAGLVARGIVARAADETDGRGVRLTLTRSGERLCEGLIRAAAERNDAFLGCLAPARAGVPRGRAQQARRPGARVHPAGEDARTGQAEALTMPFQDPHHRAARHQHPIFQAAMSWASSNAELVIAVSKAGGLGVIGAGPMYPDDFRAAIRKVKAGTDNPYAVNIPLYNKRAATFLDIVARGGDADPGRLAGRAEAAPRALQGAGMKWLHVTASPVHAKKAEEAGVDALVAVGVEAGGHPPPDEVGTLVLVRAVCKAVQLPVVASGGVADGAGIAAMFCLGAEGVQLGTRFLPRPRRACTRPTSGGAGGRHPGTTLVGRGKLPIRQSSRTTSPASTTPPSGAASRRRR